MSSSDVLELTESLRRTDPIVWAAIECYHYETHTRHYTETGKDGETHHRVEHYQVRVVTHSARENWVYRAVTDGSGPSVYQPFLRVLQIHFEP